MTKLSKIEMVTILMLCNKQWIGQTHCHAKCFLNCYYILQYLELRTTLFLHDSRINSIKYFHQEK